MTKNMENLENRRRVVQAELDSTKDPTERNRMGQFATPPALAIEILRYAKEHMDENATIRFMDPAMGTGSFYSALLEIFPASRLAEAVGYEIDPHYGLAAARLWCETRLHIRLRDFTRAEPPTDTAKCNLLICNPPYVRHYYIPRKEKQRLKVLAWKTCGMDVNGLAGLYCYFLGLCHAWMSTTVRQ